MPVDRFQSLMNGSMQTNAQTQKEFVLNALDRFECPLTRYAARLFNGDNEGARDVVQHTFLRLSEQDPDEVTGKLAPWLYTVCRNRIFDVLRKTSGAPIGSEMLDQLEGRELDPAEWMETNDLMFLVGRLIDELPPSERETADLWSQGFTNSQMAQITGKTNVAIRVTLHRAIKQLRQHPAIAQWLVAGKRGDMTLPSSAKP